VKKTPYLTDVSNSAVMQNLLSETLHEMLEIKGKYTVVPFFYPGWPTAEFVKALSFKISDAMYKTGEILARKKYASFNPVKTKISSEIINEMWMEASRIITQEIYESFQKGIPTSNRIPGLRESIKKGAIIPIPRDDRDTEGVRAVMETKLNNGDYLDDLLRKFREKYFSYMQENYDLFKEQGNEQNKEIRPKIH